MVYFRLPEFNVLRKSFGKKKTNHLQAFTLSFIFYLITIIINQDPYPKGEIYLGEKGKNYAVLSGILPGLREYKFGFLLKTPERTWLFGAESEDERKSWITSILSVLETPVTPHDCSVYLRTNSRNFYSHKKKRNSDANNNRSSASSFTGTVRKGKKFFSVS